MDLVLWIWAPWIWPHESGLVNLAALSTRLGGRLDLITWRTWAVRPANKSHDCGFMDLSGSQWFSVVLMVVDLRRGSMDLGGSRVWVSGSG